MISVIDGVNASTKLGLALLKTQNDINFASLFNCTPVGRASDSMMAPT